MTFSEPNSHHSSPICLCEVYHLTKLKSEIVFYRLSQAFESLSEAVDLLILVCQQHQQVILLLLGLLDLSLQLCLLCLQDGHRACG